MAVQIGGPRCRRGETSLVRLGQPPLGRGGAAALQVQKDQLANHVGAPRIGRMIVQKSFQQIGRALAIVLPHCNRGQIQLGGGADVRLRFNGIQRAENARGRIPFFAEIVGLADPQPHVGRARMLRRQENESLVFRDGAVIVALPQKMIPERADGFRILRAADRRPRATQAPDPSGSPPVAFHGLLLHMTLFSTGSQ